MPSLPSVQCEIFFSSMRSSSLFNAGFSSFECAGGPSAGKQMMEAMTTDCGRWGDAVEEVTNRPFLSNYD
jgi:hypothetical protein